MDLVCSKCKKKFNKFVALMGHRRWCVGYTSLKSEANEAKKIKNKEFKQQEIKRLEGELKKWEGKKYIFWWRRRQIQEIKDKLKKLKNE